MIQEVVTYVIVGWAFWQVIRFLYRTFQPAGDSGSSCGSGACPSCDAKTDLFNDIKKGKYPQLILKKKAD